MIDKAEGIVVQWKCVGCRRVHSANVFDCVCKVDVERQFGPVKPDLLLSDGNCEPIIVLEVVVTHPPAESTLNAYRQDGVDVFVFNLTGEQSLGKMLQFGQINATWGTKCVHPACRKCGRPMGASVVSVTYERCCKCGSNMAVCFANGKYGGVVGASDLSGQERHIAKAAGCYLDDRHDRSARRKHLVNVCPSCDTYVTEESLAGRLYDDDVLRELGDDVYCQYCREHVEDICNRVAVLSGVNRLRTEARLYSRARY